MIDERREAQASLYVLGALPPEEVHEFEAAMQGDRRLQLLVKELRGTAGAMVAAFPRVAPPPGLKSRILSAIDDRESSGVFVAAPELDRPVPWVTWVPWALAACFAVLCIALISIGKSLRQQAVDLSEELGERNTETVELRRQIDDLEARAQQQITNYQDRIVQVQKQVLQRIDELQRQAAAVTNQFRQQQAETQRQLIFYRNQADQLQREKLMLEQAMDGLVPGGTERLSIARLAVLRPTADGAPGAVGASVWSPADQRGLLVMDGLPALPPTQSYQLWLIDPKLASPASGGVLPPGASGSVRVQFTTESRLESVERFAVSIEPRNGSRAPTGRIVFASN